MLTSIPHEDAIPVSSGGASLRKVGGQDDDRVLAKAIRFWKMPFLNRMLHFKRV